MSWILVLLFCVTSHLKISLATSISFTTYSASSSITQNCTSGGNPDICCVLLDLNINDGHGYGWFIASSVAFAGIESPSAVTVIYGTADERPCHTHIIDSEYGNRAWQTEIKARGGAGSASVVQTFSPVFLRKRLPDLVLVDDEEYEYIETGTDGVRSFVDQGGNFIHGMPFSGIERLPRFHNHTRTAASLLGTSRNRSTS